MRTNRDCGQIRGLTVLEKTYILNDKLRSFYDVNK
jgi:hypothetical protein